MDSTEGDVYSLYSDLSLYYQLYVVGNIENTWTELLHGNNCISQFILERKDEITQSKSEIGSFPRTRNMSGA